MREDEVKAIIERLRFAADNLALARVDLADMPASPKEYIMRDLSGKLERRREKRGQIRMSQLTLKQRVQTALVLAESALREALEPVDWIE